MHNFSSTLADSVSAHEDSTMGQQNEISSLKVMQTLLEVLKDNHFDKVKVDLDEFTNNFVFAFTQRGEVERPASMTGILPAMYRLGLKNVMVRRHTVPRRAPFSRTPFTDIRVYVPCLDNPDLH
jgi:hypothetical protein